MKLKKLPKNPTMGIICPSYSISKNHQAIPAMEKVLKDLDINVQYGKTFYSTYGYLAGTDFDRAKDIEEMFLDDNIDIILCMLGGYGASRMVDLIDFKIIEKHPKLFIGFSDVTVLLNAIYQKAQVPTIHGLVGIYLGSPNIDAFSMEDFKTLLFHSQINRILKNPNDLCKTISPGVANGVLVGGNLSLITTLMGTEFEIDFTDKIVFIEDVDEEPYRIDRYLSTLRLSKKIEKAKGLVFGTFSNCISNVQKVWTTSDIIKQYTDDLKIPIITDFASGHAFPFINLPIGLNVELDANQRIIKLLEELYETY